MTHRTSTLELLIRVRRQAELRKAVVVADVERRRIAAEDAARSASERIAAARDALRGALEGRLDPSLLRLTAHGAMIEERHRMRALNAVTAATPTLDRAKEALAAAGAARRAAELLRDRRRAEANLEVARLDQAAQDEIAARSAGGWA